MKPDDAVRIRHMIDAGNTALRFVAGRQRGLHFPEFLDNLGDHIFDMLPVEPDPRRFALDLVRL